MNKDPRSEELSRLRGQVQQLQLQLIGQGNLGHQGGQAEEELREEVAILKDQNEEITTALQTAMDENSHMSEKLLLAGQANEKLNTNLEELKTQAEEFMEWKAAKEKEVYKLKQQEKKAQVKMSALSLQHERRENVMKRKVEEANATSKRLKEAIAKKAEEDEGE